jgi:hypothetical protein
VSSSSLNGAFFTTPILVKIMMGDAFLCTFDDGWCIVDKEKKETLGRNNI